MTIPNSPVTNVKALPSSPVWSLTHMDYGFWESNRQKQYEMMAIYQKNDVVHSCIDINAKAITAAHPCLMRYVNAGAKNLSARGLKRLASKRYKKLLRHWSDTSLSRKALEEDQELVEATNNEFWASLNNKENDLRLHDLLRLTVISLGVYGIGFWQKIKDGIGRVTSYRYLPAYNITPQRDETGVVTGWFYSSTFGELNTKIPLAKEDVLVFRNPSPTDPHAGGDSPLLAALRKIELSGKWTDWENWLLDNRARPDATFVPKMPDGASLNEEQARRIEKKVNDKFRGNGNGRIAVVEQPGTIVPLTFSPTDMAPLAFNEELRKALLFVLAIPEGFSNNDGNRANLQASLEQWARQSLAPLCALIECVLTDEAQEYDPNLVFVFENVIPEDQAFELEEKKFDLEKWQVGLQFGAVHKNDYRTVVLGLDPIEEPEPEAVKEEDAPQPEAATEDKPEEVVEQKSMDIIGLNQCVARGEIDRATAINLLAFSMSIPETEAKKLITHGKKKRKSKKVTNEHETPATEAELAQQNQIETVEHEESRGEVI